MKIKLSTLLSLIFLLVAITGWSQGTYTLVVEGFDWGPAVNKVVLSMGETVSSVDSENYKVFATRSMELAENPRNFGAVFR